jgi:hypothetical protein
MESKAAKDMAFRLLELEQRFESYCTLHDEELAEIKEALQQLREVILKSGRNLGTDFDESNPAAALDGGVSEAGTAENLPDLSL